MEAPKELAAVNRRLRHQRLRVGARHWIVRATSVTDDGQLRVDLAGGPSVSVFVDMPATFDSTCADHMAWLLGYIEYQLVRQPPAMIGL